MTKMEPEQFTLERTDKLRAEFDKKLEKHDNEIDQKVSNHVFYWVMGILIPLVIGTFSSTFFLLYKCYDSNIQLKEQLIRIESQLQSERHR